MHMLARGGKLRLSIPADHPTPKRWEAWPELANLAVAEDNRSVEASWVDGDLGIGRTTILAHQADGKPPTRFYLKAIAAPVESPKVEEPPLGPKVRSFGRAIAAGTLADG